MNRVLKSGFSRSDTTLGAPRARRRAGRAPDVTCWQSGVPAKSDRVGKASQEPFGLAGSTPPGWRGKHDTWQSASGWGQRR